MWLSLWGTVVNKGVWNAEKVLYLDLIEVYSRRVLIEVYSICKNH